MSAPLLAQTLGGDLFFAFISAIAFATILAVVAGLTISASTSFAHDFWTILLSPSIMKGDAVFPLENPGIVSIPLGFLGAVIGALTGREPEAEEKFTELNVRANTGLGAEKAVAH